MFLSETPPAMAYVGGVLALVGVAVARRKPAASERRPAAEPAMLPVSIVADVAVGLVAALHLYFLVLEMFLWDTPPGTGPSARPAFAPRARPSPPTRASTTASSPPAWSGGWSPT